jgi:hypothetical protein
MVTLSPAENNPRNIDVGINIGAPWLQITRSEPEAKLDTTGKPAWSRPVAITTPSVTLTPVPMAICSGPPEPRLIRPISEGDSTMIAGCVEASSVPTEAEQTEPFWLIGTKSDEVTAVAAGS